MKKIILAANWKMNKTNADAKMFLNDLLERKADEICGKSNKLQVIICAPFTALATVAAESRKLKFIPGAQNFYPAKNGAFTGEISAEMLLDAGAKAVIVGHSERRTLLGETDDFVNEKVRAGVMAGLTVILCIGESLKDREAKNTNAVLEEQLTKGLQGLLMPENLVIAYEPIWAIGTGFAATTEQIWETHNFIKSVLKKRFPGRDIPVLYGGSVNEKNAGEILAIKTVDGALVGGASLAPEKFIEMMKQAQNQVQG